MTDDQWLTMVEETVRDLEGLGFEGSGNEAQAALRAAGLGRARAVVLAACRVRRGGEARRPSGDLRRDLRHWEGRAQDLEADLKVVRRKIEEHRRGIDPEWR
jgi:hypothetical protein